MARVSLSVISAWALRKPKLTLDLFAEFTPELGHGENAEGNEDVDLVARARLCQSNGPMFAKIYSAAVYGVDASEVEVEVNGAHGDPKIFVVGLPDTAVKESRDRVTTAINNSGYHWPRGRTTVNLAPADIKKEGPSFDLPIA